MGLEFEGDTHILSCKLIFIWTLLTLYFDGSNKIKITFEKSNDSHRK